MTAGDPLLGQPMQGWRASPVAHRATTLLWNACRTSDACVARSRSRVVALPIDAAAMHSGLGSSFRFTPDADIR